MLSWGFRLETRTFISTLQSLPSKSSTAREGPSSNPTRARRNTNAQWRGPAALLGPCQLSSSAAAAASADDGAACVAGSSLCSQQLLSGTARPSRERRLPSGITSGDVCQPYAWSSCWDGCSEEEDRIQRWSSDGETALGRFRCECD